MVEHLFCKQVVRGSSPLAGSIFHQKLNMSSRSSVVESSLRLKRPANVLRLVRLYVWRGKPGRFCSGPFWVAVPVGETIEQSRWTDSAVWVQTLSDWRRVQIKQLFGVSSEDEFLRRYPNGATLVTDGRSSWRRLSKVADVPISRGDFVQWVQTTQHKNSTSTEVLTGKIIGLSPDGMRALALSGRGFTYWHPSSHYRPQNMRGGSAHRKE